MKIEKSKHGHGITEVYTDTSVALMDPGAEGRWHCKECGEPAKRMMDFWFHKGDTISQTVKGASWDLVKKL